MSTGYSSPGDLWNLSVSMANSSENELQILDSVDHDQSQLEDGGGMDIRWRIWWDFMFISIIAVAIVGNLIVLWIIVAHRCMRTIPNAFIANMSLSDLLMATCNTIFNYIFMRDNRWDFSGIHCTINNFLAIVTVSASVLNLTAMSIDRYKAIVWPLKVRNSKSCVGTTIIAIWISSCLFALPALIFSSKVLISQNRYVCVMVWPDGIAGSSYQDHMYNILLLSTTFLLPIVLIGLCSVHMSAALWWRPTVSVITPQIERARQKKQKIVKMLMVLTLIFGLSWLPYHAYFLVIHYFPEINTTHGIQHIFLGFYWLAMSHATVNPVVYYCMNPTFRHYYCYVLSLSFLKPQRPKTATTGLLLASAMTFNMTSKIVVTSSTQRSRNMDPGSPKSILKRGCVSDGSRRMLSRDFPASSPPERKEKARNSNQNHLLQDGVALPYYYRSSRRYSNSTTSHSNSSKKSRRLQFD